MLIVCSNSSSRFFMSCKTTGCDGFPNQGLHHSLLINSLQALLSDGVQMCVHVNSEKGAAAGILLVRSISHVCMHCCVTMILVHFLQCTILGITKEHLILGSNHRDFNEDFMQSLRLGKERRMVPAFQCKHLLWRVLVDDFALQVWW